MMLINNGKMNLYPWLQAAYWSPAGCSRSPPEAPELNPCSITQCQPICLPRVIHSQDLDSIFFPVELLNLPAYTLGVCMCTCLDSDISPFVMLTLHIYVCELVQPGFSGLSKIAGSFTSCHALNQQTNSNVTCN